MLFRIFDEQRWKIQDKVDLGHIVVETSKHTIKEMITVYVVVIL